MNVPPTVLIVDDESVIVILIELRLKNAGYEICGTVSSGEEAIAAAIKHSPDFIIMDIRLRGDINGIEAAKEIVSKIKTHIIFVTGYSNIEAMQKTQDLQPIAFLTKPFDISELIVLMNTYK